MARCRFGVASVGEQGGNLAGFTRAVSRNFSRDGRILPQRSGERRGVLRRKSPQDDGVFGGIMGGGRWECRSLRYVPAVRNSGRDDTSVGVPGDPLRLEFRSRRHSFPGGGRPGRAGTLVEMTALVFLRGIQAGWRDLHPHSVVGRLERRVRGGSFLRNPTSDGLVPGVWVGKCGCGAGQFFAEGSTTTLSSVKGETGKENRKRRRSAWRQ